jgi:hypothetical protein
LLSPRGGSGGRDDKPILSFGATGSVLARRGSGGGSPPMSDFCVIGEGRLLSREDNTTGFLGIMGGTDFWCLWLANDVDSKYLLSALTLGGMFLLLYSPRTGKGGRSMGLYGGGSFRGPFFEEFMLCSECAEFDLVRFMTRSTFLAQSGSDETANGFAGLDGLGV